MIFFNLIYKFFIGNENTDNPVIRSKVANLEGYFSIIVNIIIFILKLIIGLMLNSIALIADSIHTISDILSSIVIMIGFKIASKPADEEHPFGHERIESITGIIVAVLLITTGFELIKSSISRILKPQISSSGIIFILLIFITIILKEILAQFALYLGKKINSPALKADFHHHRVDALSSIFVIIALVFSKFNLPAIDGYMGLIVSLMIMYSGIEILKESSSDIIGKPPEEDILNRLESVVKEYRDKGIKGMHDVILNYYGKRIIGSMHIELDENMSLSEAHTYSEQIEDEIMEKYDIFITVHIDPVNLHNPLLNEISDRLRNIVKNKYKNEIASIHDIRLIGEDNWLNIALDASVKKTLSHERKEEIKNEIWELIKKDYKNIHAITIKFEPLFSY